MYRNYLIIQRYHYHYILGVQRRSDGAIVRSRSHCLLEMSEIGPRNFYNHMPEMSIGENDLKIYIGRLFDDLLRTAGVISPDGSQNNE